MKIGGNVYGIIQVKTSEKNEFGERVPTWHDAFSLKGWLDLSNGTSDYLNYNAKVQDSTHIFICDVFDLDSVTDPDTGKTVDVTKDNARMLVKGNPYAILLIDNPMELNQQFEIYLKFMEGGA
ncbi:hypothetical protein [Bilifractor sp. HCP3S3_D3]|uniref:hypothetical protein n=1 Tax=Bilifractor sp. HCP3S3_D3 TaxID=3438907 RepID=UPI003F8A90BA